MAQNEIITVPPPIIFIIIYSVLLLVHMHAFLQMLCMRLDLLTLEGLVSDAVEKVTLPLYLSTMF
jgi:hypothetical protein